MKSEYPSTVDEACHTLSQGRVPAAWGNRWQHDETVVAAHRDLSREFIAAIAPYPDSFWGRGIVICAGGGGISRRPGSAASVLHHWRCQLPIQFWHLGERELDQRMREVAADLDVSCVDAEEMRLGGRRGGWAVGS